MLNLIIQVEQNSQIWIYRRKPSYFSQVFNAREHTWSQLSRVAISRPTPWVWLTASGYSCWAIDTQSTTTTLASVSRCITAETSLCIQLSKIPLICEKTGIVHSFSQTPLNLLTSLWYSVSSHSHDKFQQSKSTLVGGMTLLFVQCRSSLRGRSFFKRDPDKEREDCKYIYKIWTCVPSSRGWWRWSWLWRWTHTPLDTPSCQPAGSSPLGPGLNSFSCCTWQRHWEHCPLLRTHPIRRLHLEEN